MKPDSDPRQRMRGYIQLVATGPELSKSLDQASADDAMTQILEAETDPVRAAIFLIALRMKRETEEENLGVLDAIGRSMENSVTNTPRVLAVADPFNGYLRGLPATPFLPAVLAACGLPTYCHGVESTGPKFGLSAHMVLRAAGVAVDQDVSAASRRLDDADIGWAYLDQSQYAPALYRLGELRDSMVKRTCISTIEVVLKPVSGAQSTHLLTGFVHKAYPPVYASLAAHAGFDSAIILRGVEGGCIPSLSQLSRFHEFRTGVALSLHRLDPGEVGINQRNRSIPVPAAMEQLMETSGYGNTDVLEPLARHTLALGQEALSGSAGAMQDSLVYAAAIALTHTGMTPNLSEGASLVHKVIDSGAALARFDAALN